MSKYICEIEIPRISELGNWNWILTGLNHFTILLGKNGSGKSVLLRAWRDKEPDSVHYVVPERTGEMDFSLAIFNKSRTLNNVRVHLGVTICKIIDGV